MTFPGPEELGRGLVVTAGAELGAGLAAARDWDRVRVDESLLAEASGEGPAGGAGLPAGGIAPEPDAAGRLGEAVERLHRTWASRRPVIVELDLPAEALGWLRRPMTVERRVYELGAEFTLLADRLQFLLWRNNYDARSGEPVWWWARKATGLGATAGGKADVMLRDGSEAWVDGGPRRPLDLPTVHAETVELGRLRLQPRSLAATGDGTLLAPDQRAAVEHQRGPVRVVAPAGSGKTRTLNARLLHLTDDRGVEPSLVTAVAYNNRAAEEMRQRLQRPDLQIRTIHSLGWRIVRDVRPDATLLGEREVRGRLQRILPHTRRAGKDVFGPYIEALADVRIALRHPETVEVERNDVPGFAGIFETYRAGLAERDECDFDEQVYEAIRLLLADPELRARWQGRCRHLLVDEFQDLTPAYLLLLRLLASPGLNVFGVGDDDQTIYGYAGADPKFLLEYERLFPGAGEAALEVSYRCPPEVVAAVGNLLVHNQRRLPKTVRAASDAGSTGANSLRRRPAGPGTPAANIPGAASAGDISHPSTDLPPADTPHAGTDTLAAPTGDIPRPGTDLPPADTSHAGTDTLAAPTGDIPRPGTDLPPADTSHPAVPCAFSIQRLADERMAATAAAVVTGWQAEGVPESEIAVLGRVNSMLLPTLAALDEAGVETRCLLGTTLMHRNLVRAALAWMRLALRPDSMDAGNLTEAARRPGRKINQLSRELLEGAWDVSLEQLAALGAGLNERHREYWSGFVADIAAASRLAAGGCDSRTLLEFLMQEIGLGRAAGSLDSGRTRPDRATHTDDLLALRRTAAVYPDPATFGRQLADLLRHTSEEGEGVLLTSIHRVKGLEWDRVLVFAADETLMPHQLAVDIEEERRVLHVAVTRGRSQVVVLADESRPSRFLDELEGRASPRTRRRADPTTAREQVKASRRAKSAGLGAGTSDEPDEEPYDEALFESLRQWRLQEARRQDVRAFHVFSNRVLRNITRRVPTTTAELAAVSGVGPSKLAAYGEAVLKTVRAHLEAGDGSPDGVATTPGDSSVESRAGADTATSQQDPEPDPRRPATDGLRPITATSSRPPPTAEEREPYDEALFDSLREWRLEEARRQQVSPFIVFGNRSIREIARHKPSSTEELAVLFGVGPKRLRDYGEVVLEIVRSHEASGEETVD